MKLVDHVITLDVMERTPVRCHVQDMARTLGVDVDLHQIIARSDDHRFTPGRKLLADLTSTYFTWADDEFRAVGILNGERLSFCFQTADDRLHIDFDILDFSGQTIQTTHQKEDQSLTTGINNIRIF